MIRSQIPLSLPPAHKKIWKRTREGRKACSCKWPRCQSSSGRRRSVGVDYRSLRLEKPSTLPHSSPDGGQACAGSRFAAVAPQIFSKCYIFNVWLFRDCRQFRKWGMINLILSVPTGHELDGISGNLESQEV